MVDVVKNHNILIFSPIVTFKSQAGASRESNVWNDKSVLLAELAGNFQSNKLKSAPFKSQRVLYVKHIYAVA